MFKNKKFIASVNLYSLKEDPQELTPFFNTHTQTIIPMRGFHHTLDFVAKDKQEVRRRTQKVVKETQSHLKYGEDYFYHIDQIWEK